MDEIALPIRLPFVYVVVFKAIFYININKQLKTNFPNYDDKPIKIYCIVHNAITQTLKASMFLGQIKFYKILHFNNLLLF